MLDKELERKEVEVTRQLESASIAVSTYKNIILCQLRRQLKLISDLCFFENGFYLFSI